MIFLFKRIKHMRIVINRIQFIVPIFLFTIKSQMLFSQGRETFGYYEDTLKKLAIVIKQSHEDRFKFEANEKFNYLLDEVLHIRKSFDYPFDSLNNFVARLISPDNRFKIFNWVIGKSDGTFDYNAVMQLYNEDKKKYDVVFLKDKSQDISVPETQTLTVDQWYGALYYKIIHTNSQNIDYYTLLGWNANNALSYQKIIEILTIRSGNRVFFGAPIFKYGKEKPKRIIFEYSSKAIMNLKYDSQQYKEKKKLKKPIKGKWFEIVDVKSNMIVFDRLIPIEPSLQGQRQFYVPETNIYDAFIFINGKWVFIEDVDARNPYKPQIKNSPKREPEIPLYKKGLR